MTAVPPPRTEDGAPCVLGLIVDGFRRLESGVEGIRRELGELPRHYLPRLEADRRFDEFRLDLAELKGQHEAKAKADTEAAREAARERTATRRWLFTTAVASLSASAGVVFGIVNHFQ